MSTATSSIYDVQKKSETLRNTITSRESRSIQLNEGAQMMAMSVFSDFYANAPYAVARELIANGIDACREAETEPRVEVSLTGPFSETHSVTFIDYGIGMSFETLNTHCVEYNASTKSTDERLTGGWGLGVKSPLSLTDEYVITTVKDGEKSVALMLRDENGGLDTNISTMSTDEPNGTRIMVTLNRYEQVKRMGDSVRRVALGHAPGSIIMDGETLTSLYEESDQATLAEGVTVFGDAHVRKAIGSGWHVLMGGIIYPLNNMQDSLNLPYSYDPVVMEMPMDSVRPNFNRDHLFDSKGNHDAVKARYEKACEQARERITTELDDLSYMEAALRVHTPRQSFLGLVGLTPADARYKGEPVPGSVSVPLAGQGIMTMTHDGMRMDRMPGRRSFYEMRPMRKAYIYIGVDPHHAGLTKHIREQMKRDGYPKQTDVAVFILENDQVTYEKDWLRISKDSERYRVISAEDYKADLKAMNAEARRARAEATAEGGSENKEKVSRLREPHYLVVGKDAYDVTSTPMSEVPENVVFYMEYDTMRDAMLPLALKVCSDDDLTLVKLTRRQSLKAFKKRFPKAVSLVKKMREYVQEQVESDDDLVRAIAIAQLGVSFSSLADALSDQHSTGRAVRYLNDLHNSAIEALEERQGLVQWWNNSQENRSKKAEDRVSKCYTELNTMKHDIKSDPLFSTMLSDIGTAWAKSRSGHDERVKAWNLYFTARDNDNN